MIIPYAYEYGTDWEIQDTELKDNFSWYTELRIESKKISEYQKKCDVASWEELEDYLNQ